MSIALSIMSKTDSLQTFHPFPRLPFEIRLLIWEEILRKPSLIVVFPRGYYHGVMPNKTNSASYDSGIDVTFPKFISHGDRSPILLRICGESRALGLKVYEICLSTTIPRSVRFTANRPYWHNSRGFDRRDKLHRCLERIACNILPASFNAARIMHIHRKYGSKGIIFNPQVDIIYFKYVSLLPDFNRSIRNLPASLLKTDNIQTLALDWILFNNGSSAFSHLFIPHIFNFPGVPCEEAPPLRSLRKCTVVSHGYSLIEEDHGEGLLKRIKSALAINGLGGRLELVVMDELEMESEWGGFEKALKLTPEQNRHGV